MKSILDWTDREIEERVRKNWKIQIETKGKGLTETEKELDRNLKQEYLKRETKGIECMICTNGTVTYFDIMKRFCSNMDKIRKNICSMHIDTFEIKRKQFAEKIGDN